MAGAALSTGDGMDAGGSGDQNEKKASWPMRRLEQAQPIGAPQCHREAGRAWTRRSSPNVEDHEITRETAEQPHADRLGR